MKPVNNLKNRFEFQEGNVHKNIAFAVKVLGQILE